MTKVRLSLFSVPTSGRGEDGCAFCGLPRMFWHLRFLGDFVPGAESGYIGHSWVVCTRRCTRVDRLLNVPLVIHLFSLHLSM